MQSTSKARSPETASPLQSSSSANSLPTAENPGTTGPSHSLSPSPEACRLLSASCTPPRSRPSARKARSSHPRAADSPGVAVAPETALSELGRPGSGGNRGGSGEAPAVFLDDLRLRLGRPRPSADLEELTGAPGPLQGSFEALPGGSAAPISRWAGRQTDAAGLAAALAARLSASPALLHGG